MQAKILKLCICTLTYCFVINSKYLINYKHKLVEVKLSIYKL